MASRFHGKGLHLVERIRESVSPGNHAVCIGGSSVAALLSSGDTPIPALFQGWDDELSGELENRDRSDVVVVDGTDDFVRDNPRRVLAYRRLWRRSRVVVVENAADPFGHGVALEIAHLCGGEVTIDHAPDVAPFAWIVVPPEQASPEPITYPNMTGSLPPGMHVPPPVGVANDYSFIQDRFDGGGLPQSGISIVIPLYNRRDVLAKTLACLLHQTYPRDLIEVIVADDGSSDDPLGIIESFADDLSIRYVRQEDKGYRLSEIRNLGIRAAKHEDIILLDCDMAPVPQMVELYARWLAASRDAVYLGHRRYVDANSLSAHDLLETPEPILRLTDILTGNPLEINHPDGHPTIDWRVPIYQSTRNLRDEVHPFRVVCGGNIAFHRPAFERIGGFDEDFTAWGAEDAEWGFRAWNNGLYLIPVLGACGLHQEPEGGENETDRELGRAQTSPMLVERCPIRYRRDREDGAVHAVPLVSIYMPAYNAAATIVDAVQSALDQTITDLEVCIVDDGSTDHTVDLLTEHFGDNPRVRWQRQANGGIGEASNAAVRMCRGVFIGQLDSDDLLRPNAVKFLLRHLERDTRFGLAYAGFQYIDRIGNVSGEGHHHEEFSREALLLSMIVHHFRLFRARDWHRTAGFDTKLLNAVDYDMYLKLSEVTEVVHKKKIVYQYRLTDSSTSVKDKGAQTRNNQRVVESALERMGLSHDWEVTTPDPLLPRKIVFRRRSAQRQVRAAVPRVSAQIVVEGPANEVAETWLLDALRSRRPGWSWRSETQAGTPKLRVVGPRLRKAEAERHRFALKSEIDRHNQLAFWLLDADPFDIPGFDRAPSKVTGRPVGGKVYKPQASPDAKTLFLGVTTLNRLEYLQHFIRSFNRTRSDDYHWIVAVADDGSTDETISWLRTKARIDAEVIIVANKLQTISGQTNSLFNAALATDFDIGFKCDDDIFFERSGWDKLYVDAIEQSGREHLVYHNVDFKPASHDLRDGPLASAIEAPNCMGCFYTFTRNVLETTGYLDESSFPVRGHAHIDFTMRASRLGHNTIDTLFDAVGAASYIDLWSGPEYKQTFDWHGATAKALLEPAEKERRWAIVHDESRKYVPERPVDIVRQRSVIYTSPRLAAVGETLAEHPTMEVATSSIAEIDRTYVLNLDEDSHNFAVTYEMARRHGLKVWRFPAVDGSLPEVVCEWEEYAAEGFVRPFEDFMGRKLISSSGAWAYLSGVRKMLEQAKADRVKKLLMFDDDVMLAKDFGQRFPEFLDQLPTDWVMTLLGFTSQSEARFSRYNEDTLRVDAEFNGSFAFIVDAVAFDLLIHEIDKRIWPFDSGPLRAVSRAFPDDVFAASTPLAIADVRYSKIREGRSHHDFWTQNGLTPTLYEPRQFELIGAPLLPEQRPASMLSLLTTMTASGIETIAQIESLLDQRAGNIEVVVVGSDSHHDRGAIERFATRDPRLVICWSDEKNVIQQAFDRSIGALTAIVSPGVHLSGDFAHERISELQNDSKALTSGDGWISGPRQVIADCYDQLDDIDMVRNRLRL